MVGRKSMRSIFRCPGGVVLYQSYVAYKIPGTMCFSLDLVTKDLRVAPDTNSTYTRGPIRLVHIYHLVSVICMQSSR
jgi:hypothetical protein